MRDVAVIGTGKTPFGAFADRDLRSLAVEAGEKCFRDSGVWPSQVDVVFPRQFRRAIVCRPESPGAVSTALGIDRDAVHTRGGGLRFQRVGLFHALTGIASGVYDIVMVVGVRR